MENLALWFSGLLADAIDPSAGISGEDLTWIAGFIASMSIIVALWDRRSDRRMQTHIQRELEPIKKTVDELKANQIQFMHDMGATPVVKEGNDDD